MGFKKMIWVVILICTLQMTTYAVAQENNSKKDTVLSSSEKQHEQKDIKDVIKKIFQTRHHVTQQASPEDSVFVIHPLTHPVLKTDSVKPGKLLFAPFPAIGYALQTGTTAILAMNLSFYTGAISTTNLSSFAINPTMSLDHNQFLLPVIANIWTKGNKLNFLGDWRYYRYPTYTYGLGGHTSLDNADLIDYSYIRVYQEVLKEISSSKFYAGFGYDLDYHFGIEDEGGGATDFKTYNGTAQKTVSSGLLFHLLYDNRKNTNYPENAFYGSFSYRYNSTLLGSDQNWQSAQLEFKKYFKLSPNSDNVLAFWNLNWFTFGGLPPYFDLPSTGWDSYSNTGRGYIQSRLRGPGMLYLEAEYRFRLTKNGLLGGVIFANAESVSELTSNQFETILPGTGFGFRLKLNKTSGANLAIDYGFGAGGSHGLFFNVSEVF
jgi:outer membrane protein assembly factor BamA